MNANPYPPYEAQIIGRIQETPDIFTLQLRFTDQNQHARYQFQPGQFNMIYLYGVGEIAISIVSDPRDNDLLEHTIRMVGRTTKALAKLKSGDYLGIRGPFGRGWPMESAKGKDVVLMIGGLGCAPLVSVINYVLRRREQFGRLVIMQGVKHSNDMIWRDQYQRWAQLENNQVLLTADQKGQGWPFNTGLVTKLINDAEFNPDNAIAMLCGPELMMQASAKALQERGIADEEIWLSMERNMHCAVGHCGHCQFGGSFVCKNGPVYRLHELKPLLGVKGL